MTTDIIEKSRALMLQQTRKNGAPAWELTELAVRKGRELARAHGADEKLVVAALYLAHTVFDKEEKGEIQKQHTKLSAQLAQERLLEWGVPENERRVIVNAILAHHDHVPMESKEAEVMRNAECFKFLTSEGALVFLHDLANRGLTLHESVAYLFRKGRRKMQLLTLPECKAQAQQNWKEIENLFSHALRES